MKEIIKLRNKKEKHYLNEDGTITAYVYNEDVHYLEEGEYKDIDNTLIEEEKYITNTANDFKILLNKNKYAVNIVLDNNYYLDITLKNNFAVNAQIKNNEIIYENVLPNVDFHYLMHGKSLKENIYLKDKINTTITFNIKTNLKLIANGNKVQALKNDKVVYTFMPLFMIDSKNNKNTNCNYTLYENNDYYELSLDLDQEFLNNAIYPVLVDPSITTGELENVFDATIASELPDQSIGMGLKNLLVGSNKKDITRTLLKFILPNIKTGDNIINAFIYLCPARLGIVANTDAIGVYEVTKSWSENNATWNNMSENYNHDLETYFFPTAYDIDGDKNPSIIDITNLFTSWLSGKENNGVMLKLINENIDKTYSFYGKNYDGVNNTALRPVLVVNYREQNGLLDYMTYETITLSNSNAYVNNRTGNFTTQVSLGEILESNSIIDLNLTYNTESILNKINNFALGFNISYQETINKVTDEQMLGSYYKYTASDGSVHYFHKSDENIFEDEDGLSLTLEVENEENKKYKLTTKNGNKYMFTNGVLSNIEYIDSKSITITRNSDNKITKIADSENNEVNITYELTKITISGKRKNIIINLNDNKIISIENKQGIITFIYNDNSLINKIIDVTGMSIGIEYINQSPYKVSKITQFGLQNKIGKYKTFEYGFTTTTITDNNNQKYALSFNRLGNTTNTMLLSKDGTLKHSFAFSENYVSELGNPNTNKLQSETLPIAYTENLLNNSSLETEDNGLFSDYRSNEEARTGLYSAKITGDAYSEYYYNFEENKTYTFSAYFKSSNSSKIMFTFIGTNGSHFSNKYTIMPNEEFERFEYCFTAFRNCQALGVSITTSNDTSLYVDDFQLEEGDTASTYNMLFNGDFKNGLNGWTVSSSDETTGDSLPTSYEIITTDTNESALKLGSHINGSSVLSKTIFTHGKKGDIYTFSFNYKNMGILENSDMEGNFAHLNFNYPDDPNAEYNHGTYDLHLNYHSNTWQTYNDTFVAEADYDSITIDVLSVHEINCIYVTNFSLVKDLGSYNFNYDDEGNLISTYDVMNNKNEFKYDKNNQLTSMFDAKGNNFKYEYDNVVTDRVLSGISPTGIANEIKYNEKGKPVKTIIKNVLAESFIPNKNYFIRAKGTDKYVKSNLKTGELVLDIITCNHYSYLIKEHIESEQYDDITVENKVYTISSAILPNYNLMRINNHVIISPTSPGIKFEIIKNNNASISFKVYKEDLYLCVSEDKLALSSLTDSPSFEFYLEDTDTNEYIETTSEYTDDGKYIKKVTDSLGKITLYNVNKETGLTDSITNALGIENKYTYNELGYLKSVELDNKKVEYTYDNDLVKSIKTGNKVYGFEYDEFLNQSKITINNNTLITNEYASNNGNIKSITYGNGEKTTNEYDAFNRLLKTDNYLYHYNNLGLLSYITKDNSIYERYTYDYAKRLKSYSYQDKFRLKYQYDENDNVNHKEYTLYDNIYNLNYEFNQNDAVTKIIFDNNYLSYDHDYLGRITSRSINNHIKDDYTYKKNGNKTTLIIDTLTQGSNKYSYSYDDLYNITGITKNNEITNEYTYDNKNQLLSDTDYALNKKYIYTYDDEGNILTKDEYDLNSNTLIRQDNFSYNNDTWEDELTRFNDEDITYDAIGNPLTIGVKNLTWTKGRRLASYHDGENLITYTYNKDGIRTNKYDNNTKINYYLEGNKVIFEERTSVINGENTKDMLYYIYDDSASILGFKYNDEQYYYQKNYQNDITGIYDSNYNLVVEYKYDAWGKITSISDLTPNHIGTLNPFRYRSYYYDEETKLYYLNSRYYNPEWCRFINADGIIGASRDILSLNLFAYVSNNPCNESDESGYIPGLAIASSLGIGLKVLGVAAAVYIGLKVVAITMPALINTCAKVYSDLADSMKQNNPKQKKDERKKGKQAVYALVTNDPDQEIRYIGRTNDIERRKKEYKHTPGKEELELIQISRYVDYRTARGLEELYLMRCLMDKDGKYMLNKIHGISTKNPYYDDYLTSAVEYIYEERKVGGHKWD